VSKIGYLRGQAADLSRENWAGTGPRPLGWTAWYPTEAEQPEEEVFLGREGAAWMTMGKVVTQGELRRQTEPFPVVLMSHGTGGSAADLGWLGIRLAAKGFVVLGVDHHGNTAVEPFRPEGFLCWWERARDLSIVLDLLAELEPFQGRLDFGKVFAAGFSLGGYTVLSLGGAITHMRLFSDWMTARGITRGPREFPDIASHVAPLLERSRVFRASWERPSQSYRDARVKAILSCAPAPTVRAFQTRACGISRCPSHLLSAARTPKLLPRTAPIGSTNACPIGAWSCLDPTWGMRSSSAKPRLWVARLTRSRASTPLAWIAVQSTTTSRHALSHYSGSRGSATLLGLRPH
jgi:predicted dienelactone hydrolase